MISREEILNLASLARLKVSEDEALKLQKDVTEILEYVGQVSAVSVPDKKDERPEPRNVMRGDVEYENVLSKKEDALRAAFPTSEGGYNIVRKILTKDE